MSSYWYPTTKQDGRDTDIFNDGELIGWARKYAGMKPPKWEAFVVEFDSAGVESGSRAMGRLYDTQAAAVETVKRYHEPESVRAAREAAEYEEQAKARAMSRTYEEGWL